VIESQLYFSYHISITDFIKTRSNNMLSNRLELLKCWQTLEK